MSAQPSSDRCSFVHPRDGWQCIASHRHDGACRKHPEPKVGDLFGNVRVLSLFRGRAPNEKVSIRADLRAEVECMTCGARGNVYIFNLRSKPPTCTKRGGCNR